MQQALMGGSIQAGMEDMIKVYDAKFGLDKPLLQQYVTYFSDLAHLDFNYSISAYPKTVVSIMAEALPWTIGLLGTTTFLSFALGNFLGALLGWPRAPKFLVNFLLPPLLTLSAVPYYLLGLILLYLLSFRAKWFPVFGGYTGGAIPDWSTLAFWGDVLHHSLLPAFSIVLAAIGFWALGMRAMVVSTLGEDYITFAEARGLKPRTIFLRYAVRNSLLTQSTALALSLGNILSGAILVEIVFAYPGIGTVLFRAIKEADFYVIQGVILGIIFSLGVATFILDLIYPLLDPRITYRRA